MHLRHQTGSWFSKQDHEGCRHKQTAVSPGQNFEKGAAEQVPSTSNRLDRSCFYARECRSDQIDKREGDIYDSRRKIKRESGKMKNSTELEHRNAWECTTEVTEESRRTCIIAKYASYMSTYIYQVNQSRNQRSCAKLKTHVSKGFPRGCWVSQPDLPPNEIKEDWEIERENPAITMGEFFHDDGFLVWKELKDLNMF